MFNKIKNIVEDFNFNDVKATQNYDELLVNMTIDEIKDYLIEHTSNFNNLGIEIVLLFEVEKKLLTKKNYPHGAYLIDSKFRVSTFNLRVAQIVDHENKKCPVKFFVADEISFISNTFEETPYIEYATCVSYYNNYCLKNISVLPKLCKKIQLVVFSDANPNQNMSVLDFSSTKCHNIEIRNYICDKIITNRANEYLTYALESSTGFNRRTNQAVIPTNYRQYSNITSMFYNTQYDRIHYISMFGHTNKSFYDGYVYPHLETVIGNDWIKFVCNKKLTEDFNFNNVQDNEVTNNVVDSMIFKKTRDYLKQHLGNSNYNIGDFNGWTVIPVTEIDMTIPEYVQSSPAMLQLAMSTRYKNIIIINMDGSISTFNTERNMDIYDDTCTELPIKFKYVESLTLHCKNLKKFVDIEYANNIKYYDLTGFKKLTPPHTCCKLEFDFRDVESPDIIDISKAKIKQLNFLGCVKKVIVSNNTEGVDNHTFYSNTCNTIVHNIDTGVDFTIDMSNRGSYYRNKNLDKTLKDFYDDLSPRLDYDEALYISNLNMPKEIKESINFNDVIQNVDQDVKFLEHFVVEFLEACSYRNNYEYEITDDFSVNIKAFLIVDKETWVKDNIPFKINKLDGTLLMNGAKIKSLDFMPNEITGSLSIVGCPNITEINWLPEITGRQMLKGFINIERNRNLKAIHLNSMDARKLMIVNNKNLTDITLDYYEMGYLKIQNNDSLQKIERFPVCLNGSVILYNNKNLEDITSINNVERIEKPVYIANTKIDTNTLSDYVRRKINNTTTKCVTR